MCRNYDAGECEEDGCSGRITCGDFMDRRCADHSINGSGMRQFMDYDEDDEDELPKKTLREWWAGEPSLRRHPLRWAVWLLDEGLDRIPVREDGRWFRRGGLGCRLALHRFWWVES